MKSLHVALVIGGTGMLADLVRSLTSDFDIVGVVGREKSKFLPLKVFSDKIVPIVVDYSDKAAFNKAIRAFINEYDKPSLLVSWIHSTSPDIPVLAASHCSRDFYDVTGTSGRNPNHISHGREAVIRQKNIRYHRVILGKIDGRWLTNKEISSGVKLAIKTNASEHVVGE